MNENRHYTVDLPWVENHASVSRNLNIAKSRLNNTMKKLNKDSLFDEYDKVLTEWLDQGIIERVPDDELRNPAHYLPHRHVVKYDSSAAGVRRFRKREGVSLFKSMSRKRA